MPKKKVSCFDQRSVIAKRIELLRQALGLTQAEFAHVTGVGQSQVSKWQSISDQSPKSFESAQERLIELFSVLNGDLSGIEDRFKRYVGTKGKVDRGKVPEEHSPVREDLALLTSCAGRLCDHSPESDAAWKSLENSCSLLSSAPWRESRVLSGDDSKRGLAEDLTVHGQGFVWALDDRHIERARASRAHDREQTSYLWSNFVVAWALSKRTGDAVDLGKALDKDDSEALLQGLRDLVNEVAPRSPFWDSRPTDPYASSLYTLYVVLGCAKNEDGTVSQEIIDGVLKLLSIFLKLATYEQNDFERTFLLERPLNQWLG